MKKIALCLSLLFPGALQAEPTLSFLLAQCDGKKPLPNEPRVNIAGCLGYLNGALGEATLSGAICPEHPENVEPVLEALRNRVAVKDEPLATGLHSLLVTLYPCKLSDSK